MRGRAVALETPLLPFTGSTDSTRIASQMAAEFAGLAVVTKRSFVLGAIRFQPRTDNELARDLSMNPNTVRPRRIELVKAGLVVDSGEKRKGSTVWRVK